MTVASRKLRWTACRSMKSGKMRAESQWNDKCKSEFTPVLQENSNEDELAGPSTWLPHPCRRGVGRKSRVRADAGARRRNRDGLGDLERRHYTSATTRR